MPDLRLQAGSPAINAGLVTSGVAYNGAAPDIGAYEGAVIAFDAATAATVVASSNTIAHTPVGTPRGVIVFVCLGLEGTDVITTVTYGGTAVPQISGSPNLKGSAEVMSVHAFMLGANVPTGAQNCVITATGAEVITGTVITVTADGNTEVVDVDTSINSDSLENPSATLSLQGRDSFAVIGLTSGHDAATGTAPLTNWTSIIEGAVGGTAVVGCYRYDIIDSADVVTGWTQTAEDAVAIAIAISELRPGETHSRFQRLGRRRALVAH